MGLIEESSVWLVAIGKTTIHSLWIGMLILALLKLLLTFIPVRYSGTRYHLSLLALLLLFSSVITTFFILCKPAAPEPETLLLPGARTAVSWEMLRGRLGDAGIRGGRLFTVFAYLYFTGILFMFARSFFSSKYLRGLRRNSTPIGLESMQRFLHLGRSLGIKRPVSFLQSTRVNSPMLLGYLKPVIIVPAGMFTHLPLNQIETILIHELYHLKRGDHLINLMQLFIEGVLFYNPVVWIISGQIRCEREHCCDDRVLKVTDNPLIYAKALIQLAGHPQVSRLAPGAVGPGNHRFASRIRRIINTNTMKTTRRDKVLSLALLAGSVILFLAISGFRAGPSFFRIDRSYDEQIMGQRESLIIPAADTIPEKKKGAVEEDEMEEEASIEEKYEEPEWEELEKEMEAAREDAERAMEEIDWEKLQKEMEGAREDAKRAMEEIDWEKLQKEMEGAREDAKRAMEEIDWEKIKEEMEANISEMKVDMGDMRLEIENSLDEIDWDEIRDELEKSRVFLDSIRIEMDR